MSLRGWCILAVALLALGGCSLSMRGPLSSVTGGRGNSGRDVVKANVSYSIWVVRGRRVMLRFLVPVSEAVRAVGRGSAARVSQRLGDYLLAHTAVRAAGKDCPPEDQGYDIGRVDPIVAGAGLYGFEIFFRCPAAGAMTLADSAFFARLAGEVNFAQVEVRGGSRQALFTASREQLMLPNRGAGRSAGAGAYAELGAAHGLHSPALWCLLLGSVWLLARAPRLRWLSLALAGGYVAALGAALAGWIAPHGALLGAYSGFLIALLPLQYLSRGLRSPLRACTGTAVVLAALAAVAWGVHLPTAAVLLVGMTFAASGVVAAYAGRSDDSSLSVPVLFLAALLDGCTLPPEIAPLQLPVSARLPMLAGFDAGALLAAAVLVMLALAARRLIAGRAVDGGRLAGPAATLASDLLAAGLGVIGVFGLISKSFAR